MRKSFSKLAFTASLGLALALTLSCGDSDSGGGDSGAVTKDKISGVCEKGPFSQAMVTIYELNENMEKTGNSFTGTTDGKGNYVVEITSGKLASPYIVLEVNGKYANEVSGGQTTGSIKLNAVADVSGSKSTANINVLTHLEYDKVIKLAKSGKKFEEAKKEAQKEVLNALGFSATGVKNSEDISLFGGSASDSLLLVASVWLQGERSVQDVSALLEKFSEQIKDNGTLSSSTKAEIENGFKNVDLGEVMDNLQNLNPDAKVPDIEDIKDKFPKDDPSSGSAGTSSSSSGGEQPILSSSSGGAPYPSSSSILPPQDTTSILPPRDTTSILPPRDTTSILPPRDTTSILPPQDTTIVDTTNALKMLLKRTFVANAPTCR